MIAAADRSKSECVELLLPALRQWMLWLRRIERSRNAVAFEQDDRAEDQGPFSLGADSRRRRIIHGGIIATLLDEVMGKANRFGGAGRDRRAQGRVSAAGTGGQNLRVEGCETEVQGRNLFLAGRNLRRGRNAAGARPRAGL